MGWMDSKQSSTATLDPVTAAGKQTALNYATWAGSQPFAQYGGPWHAGLTPDQQQGFNLVRNSGNVGAPEINQAQSVAGGVSRYSPTSVNAGTGSQFMGQYFNPFLSQVAGGMVDDMGRARTMQMISDEDKALAAGAYGGSRHGVMDAETTRGFYDTLGKNLGSLYAGGFDTAARLGMQDADRDFGADTFNVGQQTDAQRLRLGSADLLARTGQQEFDNYTDWGKNMLGIGGVQQANNQQYLDSERAKFNEWRDYPMRQSQIINNAVQGMPTATSTTGTSTPSAMSGLGSLASIAALFFASDEDVKSDVSTLGSEEDVLRGLKKTPVKTWRYDPRKGGPNDGGKKHIGPMAQDMKRNLGIGTGRALPVVDVLGAHHAAISALAKKVDRKGVTDVKIKRKGK